MFRTCPKIGNMDEVSLTVDGLYANFFFFLIFSAEMGWGGAYRPSNTVLSSIFYSFLFLSYLLFLSFFPFHSFFPLSFILHSFSYSLFSWFLSATHFPSLLNFHCLSFSLAIIALPSYLPRNESFQLFALLSPLPQLS